MRWAHGDQLELSRIVGLPPVHSNLQHTLIFISHRGLGWAGTGIKSSAEEQLLKAGYKSLRGQRQESHVGISLQP